MELNKLTEVLIEQLDEHKAVDITTIDVTDKTSIADSLIICTGRSSRHVKAIASNLIAHFKQIKFPPISQTGLETNEWALLDFGDVIVHIMVADVRGFYNLEGLWSEIISENVSEKKQS